LKIKIAFEKKKKKNSREEHYKAYILALTQWTHEVECPKQEKINGKFSNFFTSTILEQSNGKFRRKHYFICLIYCNLFSHKIG